MIDYQLADEELAELHTVLKKIEDKRDVYRIHAVIFLGSGWSAEQVSSALFIHADTARSYYQKYQQGGLTGLLHTNYRGSEPDLTPEHSWNFWMNM